MNILGSKLKDFGRGGENHRGNIGITLQKTKLLRTNISVEAQVSADAPKPVSEKTPDKFEFFSSKVIFFSGAASERGAGKRTPADPRSASLWFPPCWVFVVAALGCSEISSQQTTKTDFQQQFVRFLKEGCEFNESHCNQEPPSPSSPPQQWSCRGTQYLSAWCYLSHVKWGDQQSKDKRSNRRTRRRTGEEEEIYFLSFFLSWSTQIVYSSKSTPHCKNTIKRPAFKTQQVPKAYRTNNIIGL